MLPNPNTNLKGLEENAIIPSEANFNIFINGYFVLPANLSSLSYSIYVCSKPTQLIMPRINLFLSGILLKASTTFLSISLKSPVSVGIFTSEIDFKNL